MPAPHPPEFRRRAVDLTRQPGASVAHIAKDLGISESGLRRWMAQDDIDSGRKEGLSTADREELRAAGLPAGPGGVRSGPLDGGSPRYAPARRLQDRHAATNNVTS
jgi:Transposase